MRKYGFGVDIGGTTCKIGLFEMNGKLLEKWEIKTDKQDEGRRILNHVADAVTEKLKERKIPVEEVEGIGLDVPGPVDKQGNVLLAVNLGWKDYPAAELLEDLTGMKVKIGNDANVAALGELWQGGGKGYEDMVMVTLGTGVGGAVILDGRIISGAHGIGGEVGHMTIRPEEEEQCNCGKHGCLEQYASATGIVRLTRKLLKTGAPSVLKDDEYLSAKAVFDAAKAKDAVAVQAVDQLGTMLGLALADISCTVDPGIFVIGGGVSRAGDILLETVKKHFEPQTLPAGRSTKFALAVLGNDAGMYGCVRMLLG